MAPDPSDPHSMFVIAHADGHAIGIARATMIRDAFPHAELFAGQMERPELQAVRAAIATVNSVAVRAGVSRQGGPGPWPREDYDRRQGVDGRADPASPRCGSRGGASHHVAWHCRGVLRPSRLLHSSTRRFTLSTATSSIWGCACTIPSTSGRSAAQLRIWNTRTTRRTRSERCIAYFRERSAAILQGKRMEEFCHAELASDPSPAGTYAPAK